MHMKNGTDHKNESVREVDESRVGGSWDVRGVPETCP